MSARWLISLALLSAPACIADDHEAPAPAVPGQVEPEGEDWAADPRTPSLDDPRTGLAPTSRGPIDRGDPRSLPRLAGVKLQATFDLTEQELRAGHDDLRQAELLMRRAELLLVRAESDDREQAIQTLTDLLDPRYARYRRRDDALFYLGFELRGGGEVDAFKRTMLELIRTHPNSPWIPEAYVAFGDLYYTRGELEPAKQFYEKVVASFPRERVAVYASYRWAWCELSSGDATRSLERFVTAIERALARDDAESMRVLDAARGDLALAYAHAGRPDRAWRFFERFGRGPGAENHAAEMALELVLAYRGLGENEAAATVCRELERHAGPAPACEP